MPEAAATDRARRYNDTYLDEARQLYAVLTDGFVKQILPDGSEKRLGYHVRRGLALRYADTKKPIVSSYTSEWRPARERAADGSEKDRRLNSFVLQQHLLGKYDVAWESPPWTSLIVFDIDRPEVTYAHGEPFDPARELEADLARDAVLAEVWDAFDFDKEKQPVVLRTPGDGYHVYLPLCRSESAEERTWPAAWAREHIEHHLNQHGIELRPGRLELFPSGIRLRAPCGAKTALLRPTRPDFSDDLGLELANARFSLRKDPRTGESKQALVRQVGPMVRAFLADIEAARRPLEAWTERKQPAWDATWGPWGARSSDETAREKSSTRSSGVTALSQHKEEVPGVAGRKPLPSSGTYGYENLPSAGGLLLYGAAFRERVRTLSEEGLCERGERHDAALKLAWHWGKARGLDRQTTLSRVREWLTSFEHVSATRERSAYVFVRDTMREVAHYFDRHVEPAGGCTGPRGADLALRPLPKADRAAILPEVDPDARKATEIVLRFLRGEADRSGRVPHSVNLSGKILSALCGERRVRALEADGTVRRRRAYVVAIEELTRLGILAMHTNYSTGRHGRLYTCWYRFGAGALPSRDTTGELLVGERRVEEGQLRVFSNGEGAIHCRLAVRLERSAVSASGSSPPSASAKGAAPWWLRMYGRRAFTPAEFFEGEERKVLPGPFRHQWRDQGTAAIGNEQGAMGQGPPPDSTPSGPSSTPPSSGSGPPRSPCPAPSSASSPGASGARSAVSSPPTAPEERLLPPPPSPTPASANSSSRGSTVRPASPPKRAGPTTPAPSPPTRGAGAVGADSQPADAGTTPSVGFQERSLDQTVGSEPGSGPRIDREPTPTTGEDAHSASERRSGGRHGTDPSSDGCDDQPPSTPFHDEERARHADFARLFVDGNPASDDRAPPGSLEETIARTWRAWERRGKR